MSGGVGPTCDITLPKAELHQPDVFANGPRPWSFFTLRQLHDQRRRPRFRLFLHPLHVFHLQSRISGETNKILTIYVLVGAVIGLFVPIAYIFHGIIEGDTEGIKAAASHVFLLASQVFMEGLFFSRRFSLSIRVFVPVFYNSMRISSILEWLRCEISKAETGSRRLYVGKALALANLAFWSFNLLGFLLPFYLPKAFKIYYTKIKD